MSLSLGQNERFVSSRGQLPEYLGEGLLDQSDIASFSQYAFQAFDENNTGVLSRGEILQMMDLTRQISNQKAENESMQSLEDMIKILDVDRDGQVTCEDFQSLVCRYFFNSASTIHEIQGLNPNDQAYRVLYSGETELDKILKNNQSPDNYQSFSRPQSNNPYLIDQYQHIQQRGGEEKEEQQSENLDISAPFIENREFQEKEAPSRGVSQRDSLKLNYDSPVKSNRFVLPQEPQISNPVVNISHSPFNSINNNINQNPLQKRLTNLKERRENYESEEVDFSKTHPGPQAYNTKIESPLNYTIHDQ